MDKFMELLQFRPVPSAPPPSPTSISYSPFRCRLTGQIKADGVLKLEWIKEIIKKMSIIISCHICSSIKEWEQCAPLLCAGLRLLFTRNLLISSQHAYLSSRRLLSPIDQKYVSLLSYLPTDLPSQMSKVEHRWEFELGNRGGVSLHYDITCVLEPYDYKNYDMELMSGYSPFPEYHSSYDSVCEELFQKHPERPLNPDALLKTLVGESGRLKKKLLLSKNLHYVRNSLCFNNGN